MDSLDAEESCAKEFAVMNIVSFIAPTNTILPQDFVQSLTMRWDTDPARWLKLGQVAEIKVSSPPKDFNIVRQSAHELGIDLIMSPAQNRRKKLLLADMDSTIIGQECIDELAAEASLKDAVAAITERAMNGEVQFSDALKERVALLEGLKADIIEKVWQSRITLMPGAKELVATLKANGGRAILISGGFTAFTERVANAVGFDSHYANELFIANGHILGTVREPILGREAKRNIFHRLNKEYGLTPEEAISVGDGANDIDMLKMAGVGVAYRAKPIVNQHIPIQIRHADLTALLYLQGYQYSEFVVPS